MSDDQTVRLSLPLLHAAQAQKEETHNEALAAIDCALHPSVVAEGTDVPPADPQPGQCWIAGETPQDEWAGHAQAIACWTPSGWRFVAAREGMTAWHEGRARMLTHVAGMWEDGVARARGVMIDGTMVVQAQQRAIPAPAGGAVVDDVARETIVQVLAALRAHGLIAS